MAKTQKCYSCKKLIRLFDPIITFYSPNAIGETGDLEYIFCSESCVNKFLQNRKKFWEIVRSLDDNEENEEDG